MPTNADSKVPPVVRKWLSKIGKKGSKKGRATPPKNLEDADGKWIKPQVKGE